LLRRMPGGTGWSAGPGFVSALDPRSEGLDVVLVRTRRGGDRIYAPVRRACGGGSSRRGNCDRDVSWENAAVDWRSCNGCGVSGGAGLARVFESSDRRSIKGALCSEPGNVRLAHDAAMVSSAGGAVPSRRTSPLLRL